MKNRILALVGLALLAAVSASAQTPTTVEFNVPFAFQVGNQHMPAGLYLIKPAGFGSSALILRGPGQATAVMTHSAIASTIPAQGIVTFHKIEDSYFLEGFWTAGSKDGIKCTPSEAEKEILASRHQDSNLTTVALNTIPVR